MLTTADRILADDIAYLSDLAAREPRDAEHLADNLREIYQAIFLVDLNNYQVDHVKAAAPRLMQSILDLRIQVRSQISDWHARGLMTREVQSALRDCFRASRYAGDLIGEVLLDHPRLAPEERAFAGFAGAELNVLRPAVWHGRPLEFQPGDVILQRGMLHNSAAIARIGDVDSQFSHVGMVALDAKGELVVVEALIEVGSIITPLAVNLSHHLGRAILFVIYVTDENILFGHEAQNAAIRDEASGRRAFVSPKQYLSTFDLDQIDGLLDKDIDPAGKFTPRKLLQLFLAFLLERAAAEAENQGLPWPVPLRLARPAWKAERAEAGEVLLKSLVKDGFALAEALGPALTAPGGLSQRQALSALKKLKQPAATDADLFLLSEEGKASVREATAVASGAIRDNGRRVVVVVDIGGGTSDFGVFATGLAWRNVIAEVEGSSAILTEAGDHLDMLLRAFILKKAGLSADHPAGAGAARRLLILGRQHKERLFSDGALTVELGERHLEVALKEFLAEPQVAAFADRLRERCRHAVEIAVTCARDFQRLSRRRTPVSFLFTGGGHGLPMVRTLATDPGVSWHYDVATPNLAANAEELDFYSLYPQLAVAIGGAIRELPKETAPVRMEPRAE